MGHPLLCSPDGQTRQAGDLLYLYMGLVSCPPLQMVNDMLAVQKCSTQFQQLNTAMNTFMEMETLSLSKKIAMKFTLKISLKMSRSKAHGELMKESKIKNYVADVVV